MPIDIINKLKIINIKTVSYTHLHTAAAGAERRRYRTAPEGAATGSTEKETRDGIMI